ncbi:hypothetical protein [uncultured Methanobrevibacter sp.]|uniref:hypothetical protein n=1 Tax=uncultured Methanobrevibacter sp. TaxID=253161 RepID=UPI00258B9BFA|nr:hypothetical protein [uncultured Methanobrevibacter sp.]
MLKNNSSKNNNNNSINYQKKFKEFWDNLKLVERYTYFRIKPYVGKSQFEIYEELTGKTFEIGRAPKNLNKLITDLIIGKDEDLAKKYNFFRNYTFKIKNLPLTKKGSPRERMAFRTIKLDEFADEWDNSAWKSFFDETIFLMVLWQEPRVNSKNGERILKGFKFLIFNDIELESFEKTYNMIKESIEKEDISLLPKPMSFENKYLEVAPKGQRGDDAYNTFFNRNNTHVCLMLNKRFLNQKLNN